MTTTLDTTAGAAVYSRFILKLYDFWVLGVSNTLAWQCPTRTVLLPFFTEHASNRHLDVGVGTGFYPANTTFRDNAKLTLLDLNTDSLNAASDRIGRSGTTSIQVDILNPSVQLPAQSWDSISLFYLLHCLPGTMEDKAAAFRCLKTALSTDGILYGATILGDQANHNSFGRTLMNVYNKKGIFGNRHDTAENLEEALKKHFGSVHVRTHGTVALFTARAPLL